MKAVITGDIIGSTKLSVDYRELLNRTHKDLFKELANDGHKFSIYRGDSIQGVVAKPSDALSVALQIKCKTKSIKPYEEKRKGVIRFGRRSLFDIRLSIGIGDIDYWGNTVEESDGTAFRLSGRALDVMKSEKKRMSLSIANKKLNRNWAVILGLLDALSEKWTSSAAELIYELLLGEKEMDISEKLKISQPAVNHRKRYASWDAIREMLSLYNQQFSAYDDRDIR